MGTRVVPAGRRRRRWKSGVRRRRRGASARGDATQLNVGGCRARVLPWPSVASHSLSSPSFVRRRSQAGKGAPSDGARDAGECRMLLARAFSCHMLRRAHPASVASETVRRSMLRRHGPGAAFPANSMTAVRRHHPPVRMQTSPRNSAQAAVTVSSGIIWPRCFPLYNSLLT